jgi:hypothetical protein
MHLHERDGVANRAVGSYFQNNLICSDVRSNSLVAEECVKIRRFGIEVAKVITLR